MTTLLGERLRQARLARGLRQNQVPGFAQSTIARWERGQRQPSLAALQRLAAIYGEDLAEWLTLKKATQPVVSKTLRRLETLAAQERWPEVWLLGYRFLQTYQRDVSSAVYDAVETLMSRALRTNPQVNLLKLYPVTSLEDGLQVAALMRHLELPVTTRWQWFQILAKQYAESEPSYMKVLNNGMLAAEELGDVETAIVWGERAIRWAHTYGRADRVMELQAAVWRLRSYDCQARVSDRDAIEKVQQMRHNAYVHEDVGIGVAWRIWWQQDVTQWHRWRTMAAETWPEKNPMPPWIDLWDAAWAMRQRGQAEPMINWLREWVEQGEDQWASHWGWYLRDAMVALATFVCAVQHCADNIQSVRDWCLWYRHYAQRHGHIGWVQRVADAEREGMSYRLEVSSDFG
ncbi:MAG: hypothetical protein C7B47_16705 [Sulfobacillus thermosulfidooxidans]|uniref:HTH cro/C1-type domain-containing protein n=1 Tax=Sulfobacillus thermosulfidooxidans TaxID=28034 RepID=A0A2T2WJI2_SULTH|nr:MAG: hypothetical protein C7B47_16705 [Sulfobacillus thermosulfidooxidans]